MTPHLTPVELIDALDGALAASRRAHLDTCAACRDEATSLHALMGEVRTTDVPEPSPLFWDHFSARVATAIADDGSAVAAAPIRRWFQWPVLAPLAGLTALIVALLAGLPTEAPQAPPASVDTIAAADVDDHLTDAEQQWALLADLVGDLDIDAAREAGIATTPGSADVAALQLSLVEQQELIRLLQEELRVGS